jgi:hypothetical protein
MYEDFGQKNQNKNFRKSQSERERTETVVAGFIYRHDQF